MANETIDFVQQIAELSIATDPTLFVSGRTETFRDDITALPFNTRGTDPTYAPYLSLSCVYLENEGNGQAVRWGLAVQEMIYWWTYDSNSIGYASSWDFFLKSQDCGIGGMGFFSVDDEPYQKWIDIPVTLNWQDYNGKDVAKSGTIRYDIYQDGVFYGSDSYTQEADSSTWEFTIKGLPKYDDDIYELSTDEDIEKFADTATEYTYTVQFPELEQTYIVEKGDDNNYTLRSYDADYTITVKQLITLTDDGEELGFRWTSKVDKYHITIQRSTDGGEFEDYESFILDPFLHGVTDPSITLSLVREETVVDEDTQEVVVSHTYDFQTTCYNELSDVEFTESGKPTQSDVTYTALMKGVCEDDTLSKPSTIELDITGGSSYTPEALGIKGIDFDNETEYSSVLAYKDGEWKNASGCSFPDEEASSFTLDVRILKYPFYKSMNEVYGLGSFEGFTITPIVNEEGKCSITPTNRSVSTFGDVIDSYTFSVLPKE